MRQFLYFCPDLTAEPTEAILAERGLAHAFAGLQPAHRGVRGGPGGGNGLLLARDTDGAEYAPDRQEWVRVPEHNAWCGFDPKDPPRPEDLRARETLIGLPSYCMPLGDGRVWQLPTAIFPDDDGSRGPTGLPQARGWSETGELTRTVKPEYRDLYAAADEAWSLFDAGEPLSETRETEIALQALAINYRLGPAEATALALLDEVSINRIFRALVALDAWPSFRAIVAADAGGED